MKKEERKIYAELIEALHANNMALEKEIERLEEQTDQLMKDLNVCNNDLDWIEKQVEAHRRAELEDDVLCEPIMPKSLEKAIDEYEYEAACQQAEIEEAREKDWPPRYEDVVDPEFDRGFDMGRDQAISDIIQYLKDLKASKF